MIQEQEHDIAGHHCLAMLSILDKDPQGTYYTIPYIILY